MIDALWSPAAGHSSAARLAIVSLLFVLLALACLPFADLAIYTVEPWQELSRMGWGLLQALSDPAHYDVALLLPAVAYTVAFALLAVAVSAWLGLLLALFFQFRLVRFFCASIRAVHELFWGLIFMQLFGLSATTGLLALVIPFCGIFAKIFAEQLEQQSKLPGHTLAPRTDIISRHLYTLLPQAWPAMSHYIRYRFECALRSSAVLGFIGLPTLGFHLETAFRQGQYAEAIAMLLLFYILIASIRLWLRPRLLPLYLLAAYFLLPASPAVNGASVWQFIAVDIWPAPLLAADWGATVSWYSGQLMQAIPALIDTLLLSQLALVLSGLLALITYGFASAQLQRGAIRRLGQGLLLVLRSTPEILFAFVLLLLFGPSGLPAVLALALHNGGLIAFLIANQSEQLKLRIDAPSGFNRFCYELTPRLYPQMLALLFYRWEVILRESAILGILGVATLGFYIDSAFEDIRYDRAALLIALSALLNITVDALARSLRHYCQLQSPSLR